MTNDEVIERLGYIKQQYNILLGTDIYDEVIDIAIKALETGEVYMTGEDYNLYMEGYKAGKKDFEPKQGEWIVLVDDDNIQTCKCSICGRMVDIANYEFDKFPYCHCGAKMKGGAK